jgi:hypothetical protein
MSPESRLVRRACLETTGWGLPQEVWDRIDKDIEALDRWENEDRRAIAEMIFVGLEIGTSADKVAQVTGLHRDKFVRPKAKLLRENRCWVEGKTAFSQDAMAEGAPDCYFAMDLILFVLVAEGVVTRTSDDKWKPAGDPRGTETSQQETPGTPSDVPETPVGTIVE